MKTMSSSISSSDGQSASGQVWRRFAAVFVAGAAVLLVGIVAFAYALDPYDTGRSTLFHKPGVRPQGPRTAGPSRGRDPAFNAAIIGNSHIQLLSPERLKPLTGLSFVQLSVPATGPKEQFVLADWFVRHHRDARALVIGADDRWCVADPALPNLKPFPFWLYSRDPLEYAGGLVRYHVLEEITRRLAYLSSRRAERARPDGYWDYEPNYIGLGYDRRPEIRVSFDRPASSDYIGNTTGRFPAAERLREVIAGLPPHLAVVVLFPPVHAQLLPQPGSAGEVADRSCKAALTAALSTRPNAALFDWRRDRPELRDAAAFFDLTHYRRPIAELVEKEMATALREGRRNPGG
jgi:hypothetical protein